MNFAKSLIVVLTLGLLALGDPASAAWKPYTRGGRTAPTLVDLGLTTPTGTAGVAGSSAITNTTGSSTLSLTNTVGGLYSVDSAGRTLNWTTGVVAATDHPVIRETLAGATNTPHDTTLNVVISAASGYAGSCTTANTGTAQYPHLLDVNSSGTETFGKTFTVAPSYNVMGVNCKAGPADSQTFKVWGVDPDPSGAVYDSVGHIVYVTGATTIDGWDFNPGGVATRIVLDTNITGNVTIKNNRGTGPFTAAWFDSSSKNVSGLVTIEKNYIDGGGASGYGNIIYFHGASTPTQTLIRDNYFLNGQEDAVQIVNAFSRLEIVTNLWYNFSWNSASHADLLQIYVPGSVGTNLTMTNLTWNGNTVIQGPASGGLPANYNSAIRDGGNDVTNITNGVLFQHNVHVCIGNTGHAGAGGNIYPGCGTMLQGFGDATDSKVANMTATDNWSWTEPGGAWQTPAYYIGFANGPWQMGNATANQTCVNVSGNFSMSGLADPFTISKAC